MTEQMAIRELEDYIDLPFGVSISNETCKMAIKALEEIQQYRAIGTVQHCREAVEKSQEMKLNPPIAGTFEYKGICPVCGNKILLSENYCSQCGQKVRK